MNASLISVTMIVLVIFYLVLSIRWEHVRRPQCFLLGCAAIILNILFVGFFSLFTGRWAMILTILLSMILTIVTFGCAVFTCYQAKLPINIPGLESEGDSADSNEN